MSRLQRLTAPVVEALRVANESRLLASGKRGRVTYDGDALAKWFKTIGDWLTAIAAGEPVALGFAHAWLVALDDLPRARALALAILGTPALHRDESLVLHVLRVLVSSDDPGDLDAAIPFVTRKGWAGADVSLLDSPVHDKAERLVAYLRAHPPKLVAKARRWPTVTDIVRPGRRTAHDRSSLADQARGEAEYAVPGRITDVYDSASPAVQQQLRQLLIDCLVRAPTVSQRACAASQLPYVANGDAVLVEHLEDADRHTRDAAYGAALRLDPVALFERVRPILEARTWPAVGSASHLRLASLIDALHASNADALHTEPRLIRALARIWRTWGDQATTTLHSAIEDLLDRIPKRMLDKLLPAPAFEKRTARRGRIHETWLERWQSGDRRGVWTELIALGTDFGSATNLMHARTIAAQTMEVVRRNLLVLATRLGRVGYRLPPSIGVRRRSGPRPPQLAKLIAGVGALPLALEAFYAVVGEIDLVPRDHKRSPLAKLGLSIDQLDPLRIHSVGSALHDLADWRAARKAGSPALVGPLYLQLAPDAWSKAGLAGGAYSIILPDARADAEITHIGLRLVDYLRVAILERGGLFGLSPDASPRLGTLLAELTAGLEPF